jgi:outer membrane protein OmpA-like peptidoglycan-associated protein
MPIRTLLTLAALTTLPLTSCGDPTGATSTTDDAATVTGDARASREPGAATTDLTPNATTDPNPNTPEADTTPDDTRPVNERPPDISYGGQPTTTTTIPPTRTTTVPPTTTTTPTTATPPTVTVTLSNDASFESGSATLTAAGKAVLDNLLEQLNGVTVTALTLDAWTDTRNSETANLALARGRNTSVLDYLANTRPELTAIADTVAHGEIDPPTPCVGDCPANRIVIITVSGTR